MSQYLRPDTNLELLREALDLPGWLTPNELEISWLAWIAGKSTYDIWYACPRGDLLVWMLVRTGVEPSLVVEAVCACVEPLLACLPSEECFLWWTLVVLRAWVRGDATQDEVEAANTYVINTYKYLRFGTTGYAVVGLPNYTAAYTMGLVVTLAHMRGFVGFVSAAVISLIAVATPEARVGNIAYTKSLARSADIIRAMISFEGVLLPSLSKAMSHDTP